MCKVFSNDQTQCFPRRLFIRKVHFRNLSSVVVALIVIVHIVVALNVIALIVGALGVVVGFVF